MPDVSYFDLYLTGSFLSASLEMIMLGTVPHVKVRVSASVRITF